MIGILRMARVRRVLLLAGLGFALLPVGSALADTTIGQTRFGEGSCGNPPAAGLPIAFGDTSYVVPSGGGTITSFSFESSSANSGQQLDFLVLRPTATAGSYTVIGKTVVTLAGTGAVETFAPSAPIRVQGGDILGVWVPSSLSGCIYFGGSNALVASSNLSGADPSVGDTISEFVSLPVGDLNESANFVPALPTSKDQCKNGGWQNFGTTFKNQGDCVSFVATGGKNPPSGS